ncbi:MAG: Beta-lactamase domain protein [Parcubacteria group bacterium GW2011_GWB1_41_6]|nr:MAG: Beta-lactamase domain protein [Parcubacteria group bacterium GW2011_GWB1_41_6]KKS34669.1 MAG: Beta-lactamase domain protein [Parcubacteria group bacterium GW2011_GWC2_42_13]KKS58002.1 MAG: Beta-lactamase domain protein [Parcubacteria group bacterium GW2011_GWA2_42_35]KKS70391.1 MAG: Beta-lactamase domain protein [Parcubacteria group bacterium GW2011_GWF2_42_7]
MVFVVWYAVIFESRQGVLVAFLDVEQGDAIFIQSPNGSQVLIDAGPGSKVLGELSKVMPFYDRSLDLIIVTHPDSDHIGGFPDVLKNFKAGKIVEPGVDSETGLYREFQRLAELEGAERILARRGMKFILDKNVYLLILFPDRDVAGLDTNDASIVAKLVYGNNSFLFTGDSPKKIEEYLVSLDGKNLDVDVLKAGHHGSKTSSAEEFLNAVSPVYAVVSAGKDNRYGHPHQEVLDALNNLGIKALRTDESGAIKIKSNGQQTYVLKD